MIKASVSATMGCLQQLLCLGILLCVTIPKVSSQHSSCSLQLNQPNANWRQEWRSLVYRERNSETYGLHRERTLKSNKILYMICNGNEPRIAVECDARNSRLNVGFPINPRCEYSQSIAPVTVNRGTTTYCRYTLFAVGFNIRIDGTDRFFETYEICFDIKHLRPLYTINRAYPHGYVGRRPDELTFRADEIFVGRKFTAYTRGVTHDTFKRLLGDNQPYMDKNNLDHVIDRGHLTANADFATANQQRSTFFMENVIPQFKTINSGNWEEIEKWARTVTPPSTYSLVCSGVLDCNLDSGDRNCVLKLRNTKTNVMTPMFLFGSNSIPIPLWMFKIVRRYEPKNDHTVFLTYNNIYEENEETVRPPAGICQRKTCPLTFTNTARAGLTFCCDYANFIRRAVPHLNGQCGDSISI